MHRAMYAHVCRYACRCVGRCVFRLRIEQAYVDVRSHRYGVRLHFRVFCRTQRLQYPLIKEYAFNHIGDPTML